MQVRTEHIFISKCFKLSDDWAAICRFGAVKKRFLSELKELRAKDLNPFTSHCIVGLLMGMKFFRVKVSEVLQGQGWYSAHVKVIMATVLEVYRYTLPELHAAGHMRISDVISIVTHTSPLKTNDVAAEKKSPCQSFRVIKLPSILYTGSSNADRCTALGCHGHDLNTDLNDGFLFIVKAQKPWRTEFDPVCFQRHIKMAISIMT